MPAYLVYY